MAIDTKEALVHEVAPRDGEWDVDRLMALGEYFAAGYHGSLDPRHMVRVAAGLRKTLEHVPVDTGGEGLIVPSGPNPFVAGQSVYWAYGSGIMVDVGRLALKKEQHPGSADLLDRLASTWRGEYACMGWHGHSIPHFQKVLEQGFGGLESTIRMRREQCLDVDAAAVEAYDALLELLSGIAIFVGRYRKACEEAAADADDEFEQANWRRIARALQQVPNKPARTFFE
ncbi:MAG TPA: pyruvate formate lyase family protein, partial [Armatimonadota bacterium]|nr:pyruvate formate lyase family protein [Armatimonadota bacterium]